jgi:DNA adenine methylase
MSQRVILRPPFRWPGGKRWLLDKLLTLVPASYGRYFEPFLGGGALFFALQPRAASLSDTNADLINLYQCIRDDPTQVGQLVRRIPQTPQVYYEVRAKRLRNPYRRAARTLYLTTLAFHGIYRVNKRGHFNVPFGGRLYPTLGSDEELVKYSDALANAEISVADFSDAVRTAGSGDLVYLDPPYTVTHSNNGFVKYNAKIFMPGDQIRLATTARELADRGCHVIVSNASHPSIRKLYPEFSTIDVRRQSVMAASTEYRKEVLEVLLTSIAREG